MRWGDRLQAAVCALLFLLVMAIELYVQHPGLVL